ncbi:MAG: hypothetical protein A2X35_02970 [Elusimicrobia bacterium GWA2_61_42]|nr:MAG: hypothetical protein A2X35_02970 [Elusimicrobia bacterium GWA2_61_42]OGR74797.1 MAG: hypothetical protein A2X38_08525 [Elusimicrobia bacterium GWC2_61_25]
MENKKTGRSPAGILVVDDTPANLELLSGMLKGRGYRIRAAISGEAALEACHINPPDLILLDINMPGMDGYEVCRRLKTDEELKEIPVLFLSALNETMDKVRAFSAGGQDYITKPFQMEEVYARVETHLTLKAAREFLKEKNRFLEYTFSRFVSPEVIETMKQRPISEFLKMERSEITILFADLRGFTALATQVPPEEIQEALNSFLEVMVADISVAGGMIDKFMGDGLVALFGAPFRQEDHAWRALQAAVRMQSSHTRWMAERAAQNKPARPLGIGIATGAVVFGAYGTSNRMEYTALGHAVNLASRLCSAAEGGEILTIPLTAEEARAHAPASGEGAGRLPDFASRGKFPFKNISEPVEVISVKEKI